MLEESMASLPLASAVIDLTSDDEDMQAQVSPIFPSRVSASQIQDAPPSNHGLILPGTFTSARRQPQATKPMLAMGRHRSESGLRAWQELGAHSHIQQANASPRSTNQSSPRTVITPADRRMSSEENPAKRRKTDGGLSAREPSHFSPNSARKNSPILPPKTIDPAKATPRLVPTSFPNSSLIGERSGSKPPAILPPTRSSSHESKQAEPATPHISVFVGQPDGSKRRISSADRLRADKLRTPLNNIVQNQQITPQDVAGMPKSLRDSIAHIFRKLVLEHIGASVDQYRLRVSNQGRRDLVSRVIEELVKDHKIQEYVNANVRQLSAEYESELAIEAQFLVHRYASEILRSNGPNTADDSAQLQNKRVLSPSNGSGSGEEVSEVEQTLVSGNSSSPTTSFSVDAHEVNDAPSPICLDQDKTMSSRNSACRSRRSGPSELGTSCAMEGFKDTVNSTIVVSLEPKSELRNSYPSVGYRGSKTSKIVDPSVPNSNLGTSYPTSSFGDLDLSSVVSDHKPRLWRSVRPTRKIELKSTPVADISRQERDSEIHTFKLTGGDETTKRPYLSSKDREDLRCGLKLSKISREILSKTERTSLQNSVYHVDFALEELRFLCIIIQRIVDVDLPLQEDIRGQIIRLMDGQERAISRIVTTFQRVIEMPGQEAGRILLRNRSLAGIRAFLCDAIAAKIAIAPRIDRIGSLSSQKKAVRRPPISSLLRQREIHGASPIRVCQGQLPIQNEIASHFEDTLVSRSEWTDCCGDISTLSWTSESTFVCGATAHSDYHNMQYNKPGNLAVGSTSLDTLRAVSDHRIVRPIIASSDNAENALESMRQTQDPWLYTSVVSSSHCEINGFTFTASFDHTVKIWRVSEIDSSMKLRGTWLHNGTVNFVVTSSYHDRVATASDVSNDAIRVYEFDEDDVSRTPYDTYCGEKALEQAQDLRSKDNWAYFPATIQWGKAAGVADFLLVGYSPRSMTAHDIDIPEEKRNTGEICLWNVDTGLRIPISSTRTQNVFEVIWHPTQPIFLAATSPSGNFERETRTQIRLFAQSETGIFSQIKALDCPAFDINELTLMPNGWQDCYVTASCTDGNTYVWDTAQGDAPIHTLGHAESIDELYADAPRDITDTGVKFAAWGKTADRFYTGSSDGKVKAWDVRKPKGYAFIRTVLSTSGVITAGAFSPNFSKMLIGDATGKVHFLEVHNDDWSDEVDSSCSRLSNIFQNTNAMKPAVFGKGSGVIVPSTKSTNGSAMFVRRPKVLIPHPEPPPPEGYRDVEEEEDEEEETGHALAQTYIDEGFLSLHPNRAMGVVQGPNYAETGLFLRLAHESEDPSLPLLPAWEAQQRFATHQVQGKQPRFFCLSKVSSSNQSSHESNTSLDLNFFRLSLSTQAELLQEGLDFDFEPAQDFDLEITPRYAIFKEHKRHQKRTHNM